MQLQMQQRQATLVQDPHFRKQIYADLETNDRIKELLQNMHNKQL